MLSEADQAAIAEQVAAKVIAHLSDSPASIQRWLTPKEAAKYLRLTEGGLATMRREGSKLRHFRPTWRVVRYLVSDCDKYLEDHPERRDPRKPRLPGDPTPGVAS